MIILTAATNTETIWDLLLKGGWLMIPIFLLSLVGIYIICERWMVLNSIVKSNQEFQEETAGQICRKNDNIIRKKSEESNTPLARMIRKGLAYKDIPVHELRAVMEAEANHAIAGIEKGFSTLAMVASIAPMIGFLGTVIGMVQAFYDMSLAGNNINIALLSRGIYTAMITTVAGLIVGIIALLGYNMLVSRVDKFANDLDYSCSKFLESRYE